MFCEKSKIMGINVSGYNILCGFDCGEHYIVRCQLSLVWPDPHFVSSTGAFSSDNAPARKHYMATTH